MVLLVTACTGGTPITKTGTGSLVHRKLGRIDRRGHRAGRPPAAGQVLSPPPLTVAVFVTEGVAASVGVTGITEARAAASSQTRCHRAGDCLPAAVQPAGNNCRWSDRSEWVSVIVVAAVVAAVPVLLQLQRVAGCRTHHKRWRARRLVHRQLRCVRRCRRRRATTRSYRTTRITTTTDRGGVHHRITRRKCRRHRNHRARRAVHRQARRDRARHCLSSGRTARPARCQWVRPLGIVSVTVDYRRRGRRIPGVLPTACSCSTPNHQTMPPSVTVSAGSFRLRCAQR